MGPELESRFIAFPGKTPQQLPIRELLDLVRREHLADVLKDDTRVLRGHNRDPPR